ncbi:Hypothetical_protein [Hexamita inflata]|uniref:Hypothetical_protein n=1 Tax=Hexamita inflata TaxID=28002 RepID=A0AA86PH76_9EUKA|nr:Hypothetical protein HINF_LOCUS24833 [Hexamita inflata]CAI9953994.1 Hypothetical protein HINF_LOCUS41639 [Hexamita inflata]
MVLNRSYAYENARVPIRANQMSQNLIFQFIDVNNSNVEVTLKYHSHSYSQHFSNPTPKPLMCFSAEIESNSNLCPNLPHCPKKGVKAFWLGENPGEALVSSRMGK